MKLPSAPAPKPAQAQSAPPAIATIMPSSQAGVRTDVKGVAISDNVTNSTQVRKIPVNALTIKPGT